MGEQIALFPGLLGPSGGSPPRAGGSVRRTSSLDLLRPDGPQGRLQLVGRARDLVTEGPQLARSAATGWLDAEIREGMVTGLRVDPPRIDTGRLVGRRATAGWRTAVGEGYRPGPGDPGYLLLDEIPGAMVIGGFAAYHQGSGEPDGARPPRRSPRIGVCAGWAAGSTAAAELLSTGRRVPPVTPPAPDLFAGDPLAWHTLAPLPAGAMSRRRRIDLSRTESGSLSADVFFRDCVTGADGGEFVLHEYTGEAEVDPDGLLTRIEISSRVLPHPECPAAAASAARMLGRPVTDLREAVSTNLFGVASCTHLNDVLRGLADLEHLAGLLP